MEPWKLAKLQEADLQLERINVYFNEATGCRYVQGRWKRVRSR